MSVKPFNPDEPVARLHAVMQGDEGTSGPSFQSGRFGTNRSADWLWMGAALMSLAAKVRVVFGELIS